jgi:hypothetical protein
MDQKGNLWFKFGLSDLIAISLSIVGVIYIFLYDAGNLFFYLLILTLVLSLFMEKGVQIFVIFTSGFYFALSQVFLVNTANSNFLEYLFVTRFSENFTILFINLIFIIMVSAISIVSAILTTYNIRNKKDFNVEYASIYSIILFITVALIISIMLAYDIQPLSFDINQIRQGLGVEDVYGAEFISNPYIGRVLAFYVTICQFFSFFTILYFLLYTVILFSTFSLKVFGEKVHARIQFRVPEKESLRKSKTKKFKAKKLKKRRL